MNETWTINVLVNTPYLLNMKGGPGTWEQPVGKDLMWGENIILIATSPRGDEVQVGTGDKHNINIDALDAVEWVVRPMDMRWAEGLSVVMYGFAHGHGWDEGMNVVTNQKTPIANIWMNDNFDKPSAPPRLTFDFNYINPYVPRAVGVNLVGDVVVAHYKIKIILVKLKGTQVQALKYAQVDPTITVFPVGRRLEG